MYGLEVAKEIGGFGLGFRGVGLLGSGRGWRRAGRPSATPHPPGGYLCRARELGQPPTPELAPSMEEGRGGRARGGRRARGGPVSHARLGGGQTGAYVRRLGGRATPAAKTRRGGGGEP